MTRLDLVLLGAAGAAVAVAVLAGRDAAVATVAGVTAIALVALVGALRLWRAERPPAPPSLVDAGLPGWRDPTLESDPLVSLRRAFAAGRPDRGAILQALRGLDRDLPPEERLALTLEDEGRLLAEPLAEFYAWVDGRLRRLEGSG